MTLRVLHVLEAFAGGTERHLLDLIGHVDGVEHLVAAPPTHLGKTTKEAADRARALGARVEIIPMRRSPGPHHAVAGIGSLHALIRRSRPDIVHGHSSIGGSVARLGARGTGVPVLYTPNGLARMRWALGVERALAPLTDWLIAVSESEREFALRHRLAAPERSCTIPNGIDVDPPEPLDPPLRERLGLPPEVPLVGCLGRLTWQKAPEVFVSACEIVVRQRADAHFVLIGSGPEADGVRRCLDRGHLDGRFHWLPELADAAAAFGELDLYVLPSRFEGGPYTPLEAMRAGTPMILTDVAGNRDTVEDGVSGKLVPVEDHRSLGAAIIELLDDPQQRAVFAAAASERLRTDFDARVMGARTAEVYASLSRAESLGSSVQVLAHPLV